METPRGKAILIPHYDKQKGILDHEFIDADEGRWQVTARIVSVGPSESVYIITLPKPDGLLTEMFEAGMRLMDEELAALKKCVESLPIATAPLTEPLAPTASAQIVETLYEGFRQRDMAKIFNLLSPDIEIVQSEKLPWGGLYHGHEGARQFFGQLGSHINSTLTLERFIDSGDHVAATGWTEGVVNATGATYRVPIVHLWQMSDGHVVRAQFFIDHPKMFEALGGT
jgi:ketosteroid isomerase-like protein